MTSHPLTPQSIRTARHQAGLSQPQLAAALIDASPEELERFQQFHQALFQVRRWEQGSQSPDRRHTAQLRRILKL